MGGGDINANPRLRTAVLTARQNSMPADNIERAIKKGTGELEGVTYEEVTYEAYGPGGVAILIQTLTDNRTRTVAEIRNLIEKRGGNLAAAGAVSRIFKKSGLLIVERAAVDEDKVMEVALEGGAEDVREAGDILEVLTAPEQFEAVKDALDKAKIPLTSAEVTMLALTSVPISGKNAEHMVRLLEALEDNDDVQNVSSNMDIAAEELEQLSA
jgi:YebC/PmpR family DNA-binding regulatory protein